MRDRASLSPLWLAAAPLAAAVVATGLFLAQNGFGGGHRGFDQAIGLLGLPAVIFLETVPLPTMLEENDLLLVIWMPAALNCLLWVMVGAGAQVLWGAREGPKEAAPGDGGK